MGGALGHADRLQSLVHPVNTEITLDHLVADMVELRYAPWTGAGAGHATDALVLVNHDNAVLALGNGPCRADIGAIRLIALVTAAEGKFCLWHTPDRLEGIMVYLTENRTKWKILVDLAVNLACVTANTPLGVEIDHIFVHNSTLLFGFRALRRTVTKLSHRFMPPPA